MCGGGNSVLLFIIPNHFQLTKMQETLEQLEMSLPST
jgi:hypothetical protein